MGYLKRLADKRYRIKYEIPPTNGRTRQQKTETLLGVTKKEAEAILASRQAQVSSGNYKSEDITVSMLFERFMEVKKTAKRARRRLHVMTRCTQRTSGQPSKTSP